MTNEIQLPLTSSAGPGDWSQREHVACIEKGIKFTAHRSTKRDVCRNWFHYNLGDRCVSLLVNRVGDPTVRQVNHKFEPTSDWINQCTKGVYEHVNR